MTASSKFTQKVRTAAIVAVSLCVAYLLVGICLVLFKAMSMDFYLTSAAIVGAISSVLSLASIARPPLTANDFANVESETLRAIADSSERIRDLERKAANEQERIGTLQIQRQEMEILVEKASLNLFLQSQHKLYKERVLDEVRSNRSLKRSVEELIRLDLQVERNGIEIESDEHVELIKKIIRESKRNTDSSSTIDLELLPGVFVAQVLREVLRTYARILGLRK